MEPKQQLLHAQHLGQHLAVAIALSLMLLIVGIDMRPSFWVSRQAPSGSAVVVQCSHLPT
jgi:hypothetical protein